MKWTWGPENTLWQVLHAPWRLLDVYYANQWWYSQNPTPGQVVGAIATGEEALGMAVDTGVNILSQGPLVQGGQYNLFTTDNVIQAHRGSSVYFKTAGSPALPFLGAHAQTTGRLLGGLGTVVSTGSEFLSQYQAHLSRGIQPGMAASQAVGRAGLATVGGFLGAAYVGVWVAATIATPVGWILAPAVFGFLGTHAGKGLGWFVDMATRGPDNGMSTAGPNTDPLDGGLDHGNLFTPQQPPPGVSPSVGGVLLDANAVSTTIEEIHGAYWDASRRSVVLIGRFRQATALPAIDLDLLRVALRACMLNQYIGVSIDPPRGSESGDGPMVVSYLGNTEGTAFGNILFEADRLLKTLTTGQDNVDGTRLTTPAWFRYFIDLASERAPSVRTAGPTSHRYWFVADDIEVHHEESGGTQSYVFGPARIRLENEVRLGGRSGQVVDDSVDREFTRQINAPRSGTTPSRTGYDELRDRFPVLARLQELAKITAIAKLLVRNGVTLDLDGLFVTPPARVMTPAVTPRISVSRPSSHEVNHFHILSGGVDMDPAVRLVPDDGRAFDLRRATEKARSGPGKSWNVPGPNGNRRAQELDLDHLRGAMRKVRLDHAFPEPGGVPPCALRRVYDLARPGIGEFGYAWRLWVPYFLTVVPPNRKHSAVMTEEELKLVERSPVLVLHDNRDPRSTGVYRATQRGGSRYHRVDNRSAHASASDFIEGASTGYIYDCGNYSYRFSLQGQLESINARDGATVMTYTAEGGRLVRISRSKAATYHIAYGRSGLICHIECSDGRVLGYEYDGRLLTSLVIDGNVSERYGYDDRGRLVEIRGGSGRIIQQFAFNREGGILNQEDSASILPSPGRVGLQFEHGLLRRAYDGDGKAFATLGYEKDGQASLRLTSADGSSFELAYDALGRLLQAIVGGATRTMTYNDDGELKRVLEGNSTRWSIAHDDKQRVHSVCSSEGRPAQLVYDRLGRVHEIKSDGDTLASVSWVGRLPLAIRTNSGSLALIPRRRRLRIREHDNHTTHWQEIAIDRHGRVCRVRAKGGGDLRIAYDERGQVRAASNRECDLAYSFAEDGKSISVSLSWKRRPALA